MFWWLIDQICDPRTFLGRVPAWVYGILWTGFWIGLVLLAYYVIDGPSWIIAAIIITIVASLITGNMTED